MAHILIGIELALAGQAQCFLIIDGEKYLGFALLGLYFEVFVASRWYEPLSAIDLRAELDGLMTHEDHLAALADELSGLTLAAGGDAAWTKEDLDESWKVAQCLAALNLEEVEAGDMEKLRVRVSKLSFKGSFKTLDNRCIQEVIPFLFSKRSPPPPTDRLIYIPPDFEVLKETRNLYLLSFGPTCPSFFASKGTKLMVPPLAVKTDGGFEDPVDYPAKIILSAKRYTAAIRDLETCRKEKAIRFDEKERASRNRCVVYTKELSIKPMWTLLCQYLGGLEGKVKAPPKTDVKGKGRDSDMKVDVVDFGALFDSENDEEF